MTSDVILRIDYVKCVLLEGEQVGGACGTLRNVACDVT
jgi:hypothetical protein